MGYQSAAPRKIADELHLHPRNAATHDRTAFINVSLRDNPFNGRINSAFAARLFRSYPGVFYSESRLPRKPDVRRIVHQSQIEPGYQTLLLDPLSTTLATLQRMSKLLCHSETANTPGSTHNDKRTPAIQRGFRDLV